MKTFVVSLALAILLCSPTGRSQIRSQNTVVLTGTVDTAWVRFYRTVVTLPAKNYSSAVATDVIGNIYVTGISQRSDSLQQLTTIKYNSAGDTLWIRHYAGPEDNYFSHNVPIAVDANGNVYVKGSSWYTTPAPGNGITSHSSLRIIKYNSAGDTVWVRSRSGGTYEIASPMIALDQEANLYVIGTVYDSVRTQQFITTKYNSAGTVIWEKSYHGPVAELNYPTALTVDDSGNVYVSGVSQDTLAWSYPDQPYEECATIKYNPTGDVSWVSRYRMPNTNKNRPIALAADHSGNVYLGVSSYRYYDGVGFNFGFATIKYGPSGDTIWTRIYSPGGGYCNLASLAIDKAGNVYVTGKGGSSDGFVTVKYTSTGDTLWTRTYDVTGHGDAYATSLAVDSVGNAYVTGESSDYVTGVDYATIKYDPAGNTLWTRRFNRSTDDYPSSLVLDGSGNAIVTGTSYSYVQSYTGSAFATVKYNSTGDSIWSQSYATSRTVTASNQTTAFTVDKSGNAYLSGSAAIGSDIVGTAIVKYNSQGEILWSSASWGANTVHSQPGTFTVDRNGNAYIAGPDQRYSQSNVVKYGSSGDSIWTRAYGEPSGDFSARALAVDESDNIYVTGRGSFPNQFSDVLTVKYGPLGDTMWVRRYNGTSNLDDYANSIALDTGGNVYIAGDANRRDVHSEYFTAEYSTSGDIIWTNTYAAPSGMKGLVSALGLDRRGNAYVTGSSQRGSNSWDYTTIKYDSAGHAAWVVHHPWPENVSLVFPSLAVDDSGNAYVTGYSYMSGNFVCTTIKYSPEGDSVWGRDYLQSGFGTAWSAAYVTADGAGSAYVTVPSGSLDSAVTTIKYNGSGAEEWVARVTNVGRNVGVRLDAASNVYVAGTAASSEGSAFAIIRFIQRATSVSRHHPVVPLSYALEQNYPNPFNPSTTIKYTVGGTGAQGPGAGKDGTRDSGLGTRKTRLVVYDLLGRQVATLVDEPKLPGRYEVTFDGSRLSSGVYICRMTAGSFVESRKMILLK